MGGLLNNMNNEKVNRIVNVFMGFHEMMVRVSSGEKCYRYEWDDDYYVFLAENGHLSIRKPDGSVQDWIISTPDIVATDWVVFIEETK